MERLTNHQGIPLKCFGCIDEDYCENLCDPYVECAKKISRIRRYKPYPRADD